MKWKFVVTPSRKDTVSSLYPKNPNGFPNQRGLVIIIDLMTIDDLAV